MPDCIFCQIANGEQEAFKLIENEHAVAFLDINPLTDGHTVVIPKKHYERLVDIPSNELAELFKVVKTVNQALTSTLDAAGSNIGINDGKQAGQAIPHLHAHIIPRYQGDGGGSFHSIVHMETSEDFSSLQEQIRDAL